MANTRWVTVWYPMLVSRGARNCAGMNLAPMELRAYLVPIFKRHESEFHEIIRNYVDSVLGLVKPMPK